MDDNICTCSSLSINNPPIFQLVHSAGSRLANSSTFATLAGPLTEAEMPLSPPAQRKSHQRSSSPVDSAFFMSTSASSSQETAEPVTPLEADEQFIDQLWQQVRSKARSSLEIAVPAEEKKVQATPAADQREVARHSKPASSRLLRQPSL